MAESAADKAIRLLIEGRLMVKVVRPETGFVHVQCRGDSGQVYDLGRDPTSGEWRCTCQEMKGKCSHLRAAQLVVVMPS